MKVLGFLRLVLAMCQFLKKIVEAMCNWDWNRENEPGSSFLDGLERQNKILHLKNQDL